MVTAVFGSAPGVIVPQLDCTTVFSNETACLAAQLGVRVDHTILSGFIVDPRDGRDVHHLELIRGKNLGHVHLLEDYKPAPWVRSALSKNCTTFCSLDSYTREKHAALVQRVTGEPLGRHVVDGSSPEHSVSTGVYAICWALERFAGPVFICGISMLPGYDHTKVNDVRRGHLEGDRRCLEILKRHYDGRLLTTSRELSEGFGFAYAG